MSDRRAKMSTLRKLMVKLAKLRHTARKTTLTEAAQEAQEPAQSKRSTAETPPVTQRGTVTVRSALTGTQFVYFRHWLF